MKLNITLIIINIILQVICLMGLRIRFSELRSILFFRLFLCNIYNISQSLYYKPLSYSYAFFIIIWYSFIFIATLLLTALPGIGFMICVFIIALILGVLVDIGYKKIINFFTKKSKNKNKKIGNQEKVYFLGYVLIGLIIIGMLMYAELKWGKYDSDYHLFKIVKLFVK